MLLIGAKIFKLVSHVLYVSVCSQGTTERVCLIQGTVEALNGVHNFIAEKVREMPQSTQKSEPVSVMQPQTTVNPDRIKQVKPITMIPTPASFLSRPSSVETKTTFSPWTK